MLDEHAKGGAPVADVVLAMYSVALMHQHAHNRIADDCRSKVPDMHFLGHIWSRVVNCSDSGFLDCNSQSVVWKKIPQPCS